MKILKKYYKIIILVVVLAIIAALGVLIYNNLFRGVENSRLEGIENYKVTKKEISAVKEKINEIENIDSLEVYTNYKIIKIFLVLNEDIDFDEVETISNEAIKNFSEKNLSFYDVELFIECNDENSETYPKIGYKYKKNTEFTWNR